MRITVFLKGQRLFSVNLGRERFTVGRSTKCDLVLPLPEVSRLHTVLTPDAETVRVEDHSAHGTLVNGVRTREGVVGAGESVGIVDYVLRFDPNIEADRVDSENRTAELPRAQAQVPVVGMIGSSPAIQGVIDRIRQVSATDLAVLIMGETGSGKELVARALHDLSGRPNKRWMALNCAALPSELIEAELFGHERGAFTGALARREGAFEIANQGTIFLDEVGEMPLALQPKLLRVLDHGEFTRVGGREMIRTDVRVVAATNRNLADEVKSGRFRQDLFYRLCVVPLVLPPLRSRVEDIPALVEHFAQQLNAVLTLSPEAGAVLREHAWPGNVRELRNVVQRLVATELGGPITGDQVRASIEIGLGRVDFGGPGLGQPTLASRLPESPSAPRGAEPTKHASPPHKSMSLEEVEKRLILQTLEECGGNKREAARRIKISISTFYAKLHKYGIDR